jgi:hypothetical protein
MEVFEIGRKQKISPLEATTWDLEWNGAGLGDVSTVAASDYSAEREGALTNT